MINPLVDLLWYLVLLGLMGFLCVCTGLYLLVSRRLVVLPGWVFTPLLALVFVPFPLLHNLFSLLPRQKVILLLTVLVMIAVVWLMHRASRGYHIYGRSGRDIRKALQPLIASGGLQTTTDPDVFVVPSPGADIRVTLRAPAGSTQFKIAPWSARARLRPVIDAIREYYISHPSRNRIGSAIAFVLGGVFLMGFAAFLYAVA